MLIKKGHKGREVKEIQKALNLEDDGIFGSDTEKAVKKFQKENNLKDDGVVGEKTYQKLLKIDTDRKGFDDSNDTDNKLNYLGSYRTNLNLEIDKAYLDSDEYVKDYGKVEPESFFIHHTAGWNNPYNTINSWNKDTRGRIATQYCIGGTSIKNGDDTYNGKVVECFPNNYIGWHLGKVGNFDVSKKSAGVEINNFGYVIKKGDKFYNYVNVEVPKDMVCDLGYKFRGYQYWHSYTEEQIESLRLLIYHIAEIYPKINIKSGLTQLLKDGVEPNEAFEFNGEAYDGKVKGLWSHTNVRKDKFDMYPCPMLVEMLKNL